MIPFRCRRLRQHWITQHLTEIHLFVPYDSVVPQVIVSRSVPFSLPHPDVSRLFLTSFIAFPSNLGPSLTSVTTSASRLNTSDSSHLRGGIGLKFNAAAADLFVGIHHRALLPTLRQPPSPVDDCKAVFRSPSLA